MPTYVYRCQQCGISLERRQSFQDAPLTECEVCSGELRRVVQPVSVIFRGSGFYTTDYRAKSWTEGEAKPTADGEAKHAGDGEGKTAADGEAKPTSSDGKSRGSSTAPASSSTPAKTEGATSAAAGPGAGKTD